jgi:hypothetical protein
MLLYDALHYSRFNQAGIQDFNGNFYLASYEYGIMYFFRQRKGKKMKSFTPTEDFISRNDWKVIAPKN